MHRAKGLEFDEVILLMPMNDSGLTSSGKDDIRRLQYVAISRAKRFATVIRY